jgi:hypothetical protein
MVNKGDIFIGDLLVQAGFASFEEVADALPIAAKTGLPVGRVLVGSKSISDAELQATLFAQSLLRDRLLSNDMALAALKKVRDHDLTLYEALEALGWKSESYELTNRLGQLLLDAHLVNQQVLEDALEAFYTTGLPMARILVLRGVISNHLAYTAITTQMMLRDGLLSRDQAIDALKKAATRRTSTDAAADYSNYLRIQPMHTLRIGELLVLARQVSELDLLEAVERSLFTDEPIGETLVRTGKVTRQTLDQGLRAQKLITSGELSPLEAAELLRRIDASRLTFEEAFAEVKGTPEERAEALGLFRDDQGQGKDHQLKAKPAPVPMTTEYRKPVDSATSEQQKPQEKPPEKPTPESADSITLTPSKAPPVLADEEAAEAADAGKTPEPGLAALDDLLVKPEEEGELPLKEDEDSLVVRAEARFGKSGSALAIAVADRINSLPNNISAVSDLVRLVENLVGKIEDLCLRVGELEARLNLSHSETAAVQDTQLEPDGGQAMSPTADAEAQSDAVIQTQKPLPKSLRKHKTSFNF